MTTCTNKGFFIKCRLCTYGTYRRVLAKAIIHDHEIVSYTDQLSDLISPYYLDGEKAKLPAEGPYKALIISFSLKSSCYATMVLREVMREGRDLFKGEEKHEEEEIIPEEEKNEEEQS